MANWSTGMAFGAAMAASSFHQPSLVIAQFKLQDWHMVQTMLTATASSAAMYGISERIGYRRLQPRRSSPLGIFGRYGGNVVGGGILGVGMALAGSGPESLLVTAAAGNRSGLFALGGAVLGGIVWTGFLSPIVDRYNASYPDLAAVRVTLNEQIGLSKGKFIVLLEAVYWGIIGGTMRFAPSPAKQDISGIVGGLLIGSAQLLSLLTRNMMMGISGSYEELGNLFWWLVDGLRGRSRATKPSSFSNIFFGCGTFAGAFAMARIDYHLSLDTPGLEISPILAAAGGVMMTIGARLAGGCTAGHGIGGLSLLSTSSVVTMASAFTAGCAVVPFIH